MVRDEYGTFWRVLEGRREGIWFSDRYIDRCRDCYLFTFPGAATGKGERILRSVITFKRTSVEEATAQCVNDDHFNFLIPRLSRGLALVSLSIRFGLWTRSPLM
jgi:hypothetical protein